MANGGGFAGGFATGFNQAYGAASQNRRLRDQLGLQTKELDLRERQFIEQQSQFDRSINLDQQRIDLQGRQFDALKQHQEFQRDLANKEMTLKLRDQDLKEVQQLYTIIDFGMKSGNSAALSGLLDAYAIKHGVDPKSPMYKATKDILASIPPQDADELKAFIIDMLPGAEAGSVAVLSKRLMTDPNSVFDFIRSVSASRAQEATAKNPILVGDDKSKTGTTYVAPAKAEGLPGPPRAGVRSPEEEQRVIDIKGLSEAEQKNADVLMTDVNTAKRIQPFLDAYRAAINTGEFQTGTLAGFREFIGGALEFVGVNKDDLDKLFPGLGTAIGSPAAAQYMNSLAKRLGTEYAANFSRLTNLSLDFISQSMPNLVNTPDGNKLIIEMFDRAHHRARQVEALYIEYATKGTLLPKDGPIFREAVRRLDDVDPMISKDLEERIKAAGKGGSGTGIDLKGAAGAAATPRPQTYFTSPRGMQIPIVTPKTDAALATVDTSQGKLPLVESDEDTAKLKPGDKFVYGPTGQIGTINK